MNSPEDTLHETGVAAEPIGSAPVVPASELEVEKAWAKFNVLMVEGYRKQVDEMATLMRQLVRQVRKSQPDSKTAARAMDYLQHRKLSGSPLRSEPNTEVSHGGA